MGKLKQIKEIYFTEATFVAKESWFKISKGTLKDYRSLFLNEEFQDYFIKGIEKRRNLNLGLQIREERKAKLGTAIKEDYIESLLEFLLN